MHACLVQAIKVVLHTISGHTHAGVDHMGSLCSCCLDCLEDVNSSFNFDPLNFTHTSDEHTTARHAITEGKREKHFQHTSTTAKYTAAQYTIHIILQQCIQILLTLTDRCHMPACMYILLQLQIAASAYCI